MKDIGITFTKLEEGYIDRFVKDIHGISNPSYATSEIFSKMLLIYPFLGGTGAGHSINLAGPDVHAVIWNGSPTHNSTGVTFNGVNQWGNTQYNANMYSATSRHIAAFMDNQSGAAGWNFGAWNGLTNQTNGMASYTGQVLRYYGLNDYTGPVSFAHGKCVALNLNGSAGRILSNGIVISTYTNARTVPNGNIYLGMLNDITHPTTPGAAMFGTAYRLKFYCQGLSLTDAEHLVLSNAVTALQTAFSRA